MVDVFSRGLRAQVGRPGLRVGSHLPLCLHSPNEPGKLSQWLAIMTAPLKPARNGAILICV